MQIRFQHLDALHALWIVAGLGLLIAYSFVRKRQALERFASANLLPYLTGSLSPPRQRFKAGLALTALIALVMAMTDPRWGVYFADIRRRGIDIVFVLDVSRSMLAEDVTPNRLDRAKQYIRDVLEASRGDRVALVTFAGEAVLSCPLTLDYGAFRMVLDEVDVRGATRGGTSLGDAIRKAGDAFADQVKGYKAIIVLSDGEDQDTYPGEAARIAFEDRGIRTYAVGLGDAEQGGRIPVTRGGQRVYLVYEGQEVWSKMKPAVLEAIARAGGGAFIPAGTRMADLGGIYAEKIAVADTREFEASRTQRYHVQYVWFVVPALVLLIVEAMMSDRRAAPRGDESEGNGAA